MKARSPQLPLRLKTAHSSPDIAANWSEGKCIPYLGSTLALRFNTDFDAATLEGETLHLPLPPYASPRQIQDMTEAWLRASAISYLSALAAKHAQRLCRPLPQCRLSFAQRADWVAIEGGNLRCNWRLIEQAPALIEQSIALKVAGIPMPGSTPDLFTALQD